MGTRRDVVAGGYCKKIFAKVIFGVTIAWEMLSERKQQSAFRCLNGTALATITLAMNQCPSLSN